MRDHRGSCLDHPGRGRGKGIALSVGFSNVVVTVTGETRVTEEWMGEEPGIVEEILEAHHSQEGAGEMLVRGDSGSGACLCTYYLVLCVKLRLNSSLSYSAQLCYHGVTPTALHYSFEAESC